MAEKKRRKKQSNFLSRCCHVLFFTILRAIAVPALYYEIFQQSQEVSVSGIKTVTSEWTEMKLFRNLVVNSIIAFVMAIDLICCTCAGFRFLHTFGGLFMFYTLVAAFNANDQFQGNVEECWNGNTSENDQED